MRILHILDHSIPLQSGYTFRTRAILEEQRRLGWETFHITSSKQGVTNGLEETVDGLHFYRTGAAQGAVARLPVLNQLDVMMKLHRRLKDVVDQIRPDVIHAHSPVLNGMPALWIGKRRDIPVVYEVRAFWEDAAVDHGSTHAGSLRYRLTRTAETYVLKRADAVTTICQGLRQDILARGIDGDRVTIIPNAVDIEKFSLRSVSPPSRLRERFGLVGKRVLGFIGSFYSYEGLSVLLEAVPHIVARSPDVTVLLVGGGPDEARLKEITRRRGLESKVVFAGRVPHQEVEEYYDLFDVLVYPRISIRLTETVTPLKPLEAMARGRLVAASDVGGHRELIRDGETGVLFRAGDPAALASRLSELLAHPDAGTAIRERARSFVERERSWPASVARYRDVYARALASRGG
jgi:PEP-CTERM/exosortase A-associated glycosyltransferase